ncbi:hypothetical protein [Pukyongiella litopenaei]|uniref:Uncharacterized protein n=1 Tax=Pukyongiella litopenaei TaxID=2605946 RepID=A0A2S0MNU7_9RHOB|nr:hypothetical protein [Pukyongiella litopenaei]AVO37507.2 hypothetical protein C6Y53_07130 [Pukyongiella litopenaei]
MTDGDDPAPAAPKPPPAKTGLAAKIRETVGRWSVARMVGRFLTYSAVLILLLYLLVPWAVRTLGDLPYDCCAGRFFNPEREGLISITSPQLFTRERLVNQRLDESAWIDRRIKAVDTLLEKQRFSTYSQVAVTKETLLAALETDETVESNIDAPDAMESFGELRIEPYNEFKRANSYRRLLVQEKFQSVLDDAHDTSSNTLQRLNFDLTITPARQRSTSVATVSLTLEQPKDPEWILQKYGELLFDVREELQDIAHRTISDRQKIYDVNTESSYALNAKTAELLRRELEQSVTDDVDVRTEIEALKESANEQYLGRLFSRFRQHLLSVGKDPAIGLALVKVFFPESEQWSDDMIGPLLDACSVGPTSIWALLPPNSTNSVNYLKLEEVHETFQKLKGAPIHSNVEERSKSMLRVALSESFFKASCPPSPEKLTQAAMIELLGKSYLEKQQKLDDWKVHCTIKKLNIARRSDTDAKQILDQSEEFKLIDDYFRKCNAVLNEVRAASRSAGLVLLVKAELENKPVDTAGRLRRIDDYFSISTESCDWQSCQLIVRTKSEQYRVAKRLAQNESAADDGRGKKDRKSAEEIEIDKRALMIGRQEALRLFSELSCFASARSYTVYPREGIGQNVHEKTSRDWSLLSWFGQNQVEGSSSVEQARITQSVPILGIGDIGNRDGRISERRPSECGADFVTLLNSLRMEVDLTSVLSKALNDSKDTLSEKLSDDWKKDMRCLLNKATDAIGDVELFEKTAQTCYQKSSDTIDQPGDEKVKDFDLSALTMVVRFLRERSTTISWIVFPKDEGLWGVRHVAQNIPLSAIVSLPSWWPGLQVVSETCWQRPKRMRVYSDRSLCPEPESPEKPVRRARVETSQLLPLPNGVEDVLSKLGFFLIRYPYIDRQGTENIVLESGREATLRLTGKRLWKNPKVRLGEQWSSEIEVLPDMRGILAKFECLDPLAPGDGKKMVHRETGLTELAGAEADRTSDIGFDADPRERTSDSTRYSELRSARVWTSEGNTQDVSVTVRAFRPRYVVYRQAERPCWEKGKGPDNRSQGGN